jgi:ubiquinone/menaquinone biosynthesis C-methylase UbiE
LLLLNPLRRLLENPNRILAPLVEEGMVVLEPGCAMGYFTLPLAHMVGPSGKVLAVDIEPKMLAVLARRARKAGLAERIDCRKAEANSLCVDDCSGTVDLIVAIHVVHELPNQPLFFRQVWNALKSGGRLLVIEPRFHVSRSAFAETLAFAKNTGFSEETDLSMIASKKILLRKEEVTW